MSCIICTCCLMYEMWLDSVISCRYFSFLNSPFREYCVDVSSDDVLPQCLRSARIFIQFMNTKLNKYFMTQNIDDRLNSLFCYYCCCCCSVLSLLLLLSNAGCSWQKDHILAYQRYEMSFLLIVLWTITWNVKFIASFFVECINTPSLVSSAFWVIRITPVEQNVIQEKRIKNSKWKR